MSVPDLAGSLVEFSLGTQLEMSKRKDWPFSWRLRILAENVGLEKAATAC